MKKDKEKDKEKKQEKKKKEKDEKKDKRERQPMTAEEMSRLEEMKKGVFRKFSDRDKKRNAQRMSPDEDRSDSGSPQSSPVKEVKPLTRPQPLPRQQLSSSSSARRDQNPPAVLPKPKKSILKGKAGNEEVSSGFQKYVDLDDTKLLQENTRRNEDLFTERVPSHMAGAAPAVSNTSSRSPAANQQQSSSSSTSVTLRTGSLKASNARPLAAAPVIPETSPEAEEKENKQEPPYTSRLKLPPIIPVKPPRVREIVVQRNQAGGFGFSLRKGLLPTMNGGQPRVVTFAEPGSGPASAQTGLLPGDRLVEVSKSFPQRDCQLRFNLPKTWFDLNVNV